MFAGKAGAYPSETPYGKQSFLTPGANVIKLFTVVSYTFLQQASVRPLQAFLGKYSVYR